MCWAEDMSGSHRRYEDAEDAGENLAGLIFFIYLFFAKLRKSAAALRSAETFEAALRRAQSGWPHVVMRGSTRMRLSRGFILIYPGQASPRRLTAAVRADRCFRKDREQVSRSVGATRGVK